MNLGSKPTSLSARLDLFHELLEAYANTITVPLPGSSGGGF